MRSVLLGVAILGLLTGPAFAQCVYVACPGSSDGNTMGSSSSSSSSTSRSSAISKHEVTQTIRVIPHTTETSVREEIVREPAALVPAHAQQQEDRRHAYRHGYRHGYRDGYSDRRRPKTHMTKSRTRAAVGPSSHRQTIDKAKRKHSSATSSSTWVYSSRPFVDTVKDRATSYEAAATGSAISLASESSSSSSSSWSSSSSISSWSNQGSMPSWPAPALPLQQGGMIGAVGGGITDKAHAAAAVQPEGIVVGAGAFAGSQIGGSKVTCPAEVDQKLRPNTGYLPMPEPVAAPTARRVVGRDWYQPSPHSYYGRERRGPSRAAPADIPRPAQVPRNSSVDQACLVTGGMHPGSFPPMSCMLCSR
jgi:hypothetical protein